MSAMAPEIAASSVPSLCIGRPALFVIYVALLGAAATHLYRNPIYDMDAVQYMGNALLMEETDPVKIHARVYDELHRYVPQPALGHLLGEGSTLPPDQDTNKVRASDPYRYAEFLPLFAIRPLYNQTLWLVSKTGLSLVRSGFLISAISYFAIGILLFLWIGRYFGSAMTLATSLLVMLCPPLTDLGRDPTSDALATLVAFASLYFIFEKQHLAAGFTFLLASLFFRTDFIVLAGPVVLACWLEKRVEFWKAAVLAAVALASVLAINHFAGDYGFRMLYYRNFIAAPTAPAEMVVHFSFADYRNAFRSGVTLVMGSFLLPFVLLGTIGLACQRARTLFTVSLAYVVLHFLVLPNWQERWVVIFYLSATLCAAISRGERKPHPV